MILTKMRKPRIFCYLKLKVLGHKKLGSVNSSPSQILDSRANLGNLGISLAKTSQIPTKRKLLVIPIYDIQWSKDFLRVRRHRQNGNRKVSLTTNGPTDVRIITKTETHCCLCLILAFGQCLSLQDALNWNMIFCGQMWGILCDKMIHWHTLKEKPWNDARWSHLDLIMILCKNWETAACSAENTLDKPRVLNSSRFSLQAKCTKVFKYAVLMFTVLVWVQSKLVSKSEK